MISGNKEIGLGTKIYIQPSPAARHRLRGVGAHLAGGGGGEEGCWEANIPSTGADWAPRALELSTNLRDVSQCPEKAPTKFLKAAQACEDKHPNFISI